MRAAAKMELGRMDAISWVPELWAPKMFALFKNESAFAVVSRLHELRSIAAQEHHRHTRMRDLP